MRLVREHAGDAFDPELAACLVDDAERILALDAHASAWAETLSCEPRPPLLLDGGRSIAGSPRWETSRI